MTRHSISSEWNGPTSVDGMHWRGRNARHSCACVVITDRFDHRSQNTRQHSEDRGGADGWRPPLTLNRHQKKLHSHENTRDEKSCQCGLYYEAIDRTIRAFLLLGRCDACDLQLNLSVYRTDSVSTWLRLKLHGRCCQRG